MTTSTDDPPLPPPAREEEWKAVLADLDRAAMRYRGWDWPEAGRRFAERARTVAGLDRELVDFAFGILREKLPRKVFLRSLRTVYSASSGEEYAPEEGGVSTKEYYDGRG